MRRLLLDTHVLLWWWARDPRLTEEFQKAIAAEDSVVFVSAASAWEIAIKTALGRLEFPVDEWSGLMKRDTFRLLPVSDQHALGAPYLSWDHADPFDRMLVAQARQEALELLSADRRICQYLSP